jgi:hypothetical protein
MPEGKQRKWVMELIAGDITRDEFRFRLAKMFYEVGMVGIKPHKGARTSWSFIERDSLRASEITIDAHLEICPVFFRVLGIQTRNAA